MAGTVTCKTGSHGPAVLGHWCREVEKTCLQQEKNEDMRETKKYCRKIRRELTYRIPGGSAIPAVVLPFGFGFCLYN